MLFFKPEFTIKKTRDSYVEQTFFFELDQSNELNSTFKRLSEADVKVVRVKCNSNLAIA